MIVVPCNYRSKPVIAVHIIQTKHRTTPVILNFPKECSSYLRSAWKKFLKLRVIFNKATIILIRLPKLL
jgi:hypothetical protein